MKYISSLVVVFTVSVFLVSVNQAKSANSMNIKPNENFENLIGSLSKIMNINIGEEDYDIQLFPERKMYQEYNYLNNPDWFDNDMSGHFQDEFIEFASESDGSSFNLWYYPNLIGEPPVVYIGSDGPNSTIAASMKEFLCLLATSSEFNTLETKPKDIWTKLHLEGLQDHVEPQVFKGLKQRMEFASKTLSCDSHKNLLKNIKKHPNFYEWVRKVREKDENL